MKKKRLNEGCACEGEETAPTQEKFISGDKVNRYILQMSEEEKEEAYAYPKAFWKVIAGILGINVENIKEVKRWKLGYRVEVVETKDDKGTTSKGLKGANDKNEWMTPKEMGIAQKIDWSDDYGDEISDKEKMAYFRSLSDMYEVDMKNGLVRLKPEAEWF